MGNKKAEEEALAVARIPKTEAEGVTVKLRIQPDSLGLGSLLLDSSRCREPSSKSRVIFSSNGSC